MGRGKKDNTYLTPYPSRKGGLRGSKSPLRGLGLGPSKVGDTQKFTILKIVLDIN